MKIERLYIQQQPKTALAPLPPAGQKTPSFLVLATIERFKLIGLNRINLDDQHDRDLFASVIDEEIEQIRGTLWGLTNAIKTYYLDGKIGDDAFPTFRMDDAEKVLKFTETTP